MVVSTDLESSSVELTRRLGTLAEPIRLSIVGVLANGERCAWDLLVRTSRRGRWVDYRLDPDGFTALWEATGAAGVPLPGAPAPTEGRDSTCPSDEVDQ